MKLNTNSNVYTICYATVLVIIVALLLAVVSAALAKKQQANVELDTKKQILNSLNLRNLNNAEAEAKYAEIISEETCSKCGLPYFAANLNGEKKYILPVRGAGLWGPIWGYIALNDDRATIYSVFFNHEGETPGLGGEIKNYTVFQRQFEGKPILGASGNGMLIEKAGKGGDVDCISGATITSKGVETMLLNSLEGYVKGGFFQGGHCGGSCGGGCGHHAEAEAEVEGCCGHHEAEHHCSGACGGAEHACSGHCHENVEPANCCEEK